MNKAKLGKRIKNCRLRLGLTMEEFIERIDNKPGRGRSGTVNNWETGKNAPNKQHLKKIAKLCDTTVQELVGSGPMLTEKQKNCPYCHDNFDYWYGAETTSKLIKAAPHWAILVHFDYIDDDRTIPVKFCPKCGRPLNEENDNDR